VVEIFEQQIRIAASLGAAERCLSEPGLMRRWLNPLLECRSVGEWSTAVGSRFRFYLRLPPVHPHLECEVVERALGLVQWQFTGFFEGTDRWEVTGSDGDLLLVNRFCFDIPNPLVRFGFAIFAQALTRADMQAQLHRLKAVAETLEPPGELSWKSQTS
jgi:hypothetical protein